MWIKEQGLFGKGLVHFCPNMIFFKLKSRENIVDSRVVAARTTKFSLHKKEIHFESRSFNFI